LTPVECLSNGLVRGCSPDDMTHYGEIVVALKETRRLMEEIHEVILSCTGVAICSATGWQSPWYPQRYQMSYSRPFKITLGAELARDRRMGYSIGNRVCCRGYALGSRPRRRLDSDNVGSNCRAARSAAPALFVKSGRAPRCLKTG